MTKGENFGHALFESLSAGRPVITSNFTPWNKLAEKKAGWNVDIYNAEECVNSLNEIKALDQDEYARYCSGAYCIAKDYFTKSADLNAYKRLFPAGEGVN